MRRKQVAGGTGTRYRNWRFMYTDGTDVFQMNR